MNKEVFSRTKRSIDYWETPYYFFNLLDKEFHFTLDPCATPFNTKCRKYFTEEQNGLVQDWKEERVFVNPPFSDIKSWVRKCYQEGQKFNTLVVMILPSRTDTQYWHDYIMKSHEIWFAKGRVNFLKDGKKTQNGSTFPLAIITFKKTTNENPRIKSFYHK